MTIVGPGWLCQPDDQPGCAMIVCRLTTATSRVLRTKPPFATWMGSVVVPVAVIVATATPDGGVATAAPASATAMIAAKTVMRRTRNICFPSLRSRDSIPASCENPASEQADEPSLGAERRYSVEQSERAPPRDARGDRDEPHGGERSAHANALTVV